MTMPNYQEITSEADEKEGVRRIVIWPKRQTLPEAIAEDKHSEAVLKDGGCSLVGPAARQFVSLEKIRELFN